MFSQRNISITIKSYILFLLIISGCFFVPQPAFSQLAGTYTIGTGGDYSTISEAVTDLESQGISASVVFSILNGTYKEQIVIHPIPGANPDNTITFQSSSGNASDVEITFYPSSSDSNYVINLSGARHLIFRNLTFRNDSAGNNSWNRVFHLELNADSLIFENNLFYGRMNSGTASSAIIYAEDNSSTSLLIQNNTFYNGGYALLLESPDNFPSRNTIIRDNVFQSQHYVGISLRSYSNPNITDNHFINIQSTGLELDYCKGKAEVLRNRIQVTNGTGIRLLNSGDILSPPEDWVLIANNFVSTANGNGGSISLNFCDNINIYYNSVRTEGNGIFVSCLNIINAYNINIKNNSFVNLGLGYAVNINDLGSIGEMDYNNYYTHANFLGRVGNKNIRNLFEWRTETGSDAHSVSTDGFYFTDTNLHSDAPWLDGRGTPIPEITDDIDGEPRNSTTPDIGADEFSAYPEDFVPLAGTYTIDYSGDFYSLQSAVNTLERRGMSDTVRFVIQDISLFEQVKIRPIPGSSPSKPVIIESQSDNPYNAMIKHYAETADDNFVLKLRGCKNLRIKNITISANDLEEATYANVLIAEGGVDSVYIDNCIFYGAPGGNNTNNQNLVDIKNVYFKSVKISNCQFHDGAYQLRCVGYSDQNHNSSGLVLVHNQLKNANSNAVYIVNTQNINIMSNTLENSSNYGIYLDNCDSTNIITKNRLYTERGAGISFNNCNGGLLPENRILVTNNFISSAYPSATNFRISYCSGLNIFYNSVYSSHPDAYGSTFACNGVSEIYVLNNCFVNNGTGMAISVSGNTNFGALDYNNYYTEGNFIGSWNNTRAAYLSNWKDITGYDAHSVSTHGIFVSASDLHSRSLWLNGKATPLLDLVQDDIDGEQRDIATPDIGADEFSIDTSLIRPISGGITIETGGNFDNLQDVFDELHEKGISDTVKIKIPEGIYPGQTVIRPIPGNDKENPIIIESLTGNPEDTELSYQATNDSDNYVIKFRGARTIIIRNITLSSIPNPGSYYGRVMNFIGSIDSILIENCIIKGIPLPSYTSVGQLIQFNNTFFSYVGFYNNQFINGTHGIDCIGTIFGNIKSHTLELYGNHFSGMSKAGVIILNVNKVKSIKNNFNLSSSYALHLNNCDDSVLVNKNQIINDLGYGIFMTGCDGTNPPDGQRIMVSNNFIRSRSASNSAMYIENCTSLDVVYNTLHSDGTGSQTGTLTLRSGSDINIINNNLVNSGDGYTYYVSQPTGINKSDHNNFFTTGSVLAYWGNDMEDLNKLQTASGMDLNSLSVNPQFLADDTYKFTNPLLDSAGTEFSGIADDIEDRPRKNEFTTIGAWEFDPSIVGIEPEGPTAHIPKVFFVEQNYPNPFNPVTHIKFGLPKTVHVTIEVYNVTGQKIATLIDKRMKAGYYSIKFNAGQLPSGLYFYRVTTPTHEVVRKMLLVK